ncbi:RNA polymerase sigma factor [Leptospira langatensis]|uniref:RNA polymerase sigma factor n=1 Tax=Leptospira langatensis TaxID=2484983 RepID=A0A5F1ZP53_9LEPT|nr:RNA polymerase sigma factor [Leptospira langatensis]TGK05503.1 RNA polymerase sigma factor [Leptospira langatensis]TGL38639.1 RNA polymerase sigma factor [Leptospira langatensis]
MNEVHTRIDELHRKEYGQILSVLVGMAGDLGIAEEVLQDAFLVALENWTKNGIPRKPGAWLTTVARNKLIDRFRKKRPDSVDPSILEGLIKMEEQSQEDDAEIPDERLKLIFTCCHPSLSTEQRIAITLHTLGGLSTAEIASAFLVPIPTIAQRLVRAKRKIKEEKIPYSVPSAEQLAERMDSVLTVLYLIFTEGYASTTGNKLIRGDLCEEAIRLCRVLELLVRSSPTKIDIPTVQYSEILGLLSLMLLNHSRRNARLGHNGELKLLNEQNRTLWITSEIQEGLGLVEKAFYMGHLGPYQIQAAISALHAKSPGPEYTSWKEIVHFYRILLSFLDTPVIRLNYAVAVSMAGNLEEGFAILDSIRIELEAFAPFYLAKADIQFRMGKIQEAKESYRDALELTQNEVEKEFIRKKICGLEEVN